MSETLIKKLLEHALLKDGVMSIDLYHYELSNNTDAWQASMEEDGDKYAFVVTENKGDVAMLLLDNTGKSYINEQAREQLKLLWMKNYETNIKKLIPAIAKELHNNELILTGVKQYQSAIM